jgi:hypothetical protein
MAQTAPRRDRAEKPSVLIGFTEISGYFHNLREGLEERGYRCEFIELVPHPFGYRDTVLSGGLIVTLIRAARRKGSLIQSPALRSVLGVPAGLLMIPLFFSAVVKYDVFLFTYGNSFFTANLDLILLKLLKKRVIMPFLGSEVRPRYIDGFLEFSDLEEMNASTQQQRKKIRFIERFVDVIINNPAAGHYLERPFVNFFCLGIPQDCGDSLGPDATMVLSGSIPSNTQPSDCLPVRILHTPSVRIGKGSDLIREIVEQLGTRYPIEYTEITNRPHADVLERICASDLVIDQAYSDTPMAAFASEAACFGVPAVVGGYYSAIIREEMNAEFVPPSLYVLPEDLQSAIESLVVDGAGRRELGERSRQFVRTRWSKAEVASRYERIICSDIPPEWLFDPDQMKYVYGCGLSKNQAVERISAMIDGCGLHSLGIGRKKFLQERFSSAVSDSNDVRQSEGIRIEQPEAGQDL